MKSAGAWLAILGTTIGLTFGITASTSTAATRPSRAQQVQAEVDRLRGELDEVSGQETGLLAEIDVSRRTRADLDARVSQLDAQIGAAQGELDGVNAELNDAIAAESAADAAVASAEQQLGSATDVLRQQAVDAFMRFGTAPSADQLVLDVRDVNDSPRASAYVQTVADHQTKVVANQRRLQEDTARLKAHAADAKAAVAAHQADVGARKAALESARADQAAAAAAVAGEAANEQRLLDEVQAQKGDYLQRIDQLEQESRAIADDLRRRQAGQKATKSGRGILVYPTATPVITSPFGYRIHPVYGDRRLHAGIDLAASVGTPVFAAANGTVVYAGWQSGYGNTVVIDHGGQLATLYGHNSALSVSVGQTVKRGDRIASAGSTGNSTGPHVHFEVRVSGTPVDPMGYL